MSVTFGAFWLHTPRHSLQRVWNLHPDGGLAGDGILPSRMIRFIFTVGSGTGIALNSALV